MRGFKGKKSTTVTFQREGETLTLTLVAPTFGVFDAWREQARAEQVEGDDLNATLAYIALGLALGAQLEIPVGKPEQIVATAARVRQELADANLSEGEVNHLLKTVASLATSSSEVADAAKNSSAPAAAGA